jgi:hypothetical protein
MITYTALVVVVNVQVSLEFHSVCRLLLMFLKVFMCIATLVVDVGACCDGGVVGVGMVRLCVCIQRNERLGEHVFVVLFCNISDT